MYGKRIHLKPAPFILCALAFFALFLLGTLFFFEPTPSLYWTIVSTIFSLLAAVVFSFVICGIVQVVQGFRSGYLSRSDAREAALLLVLAIFFVDVIIIVASAIAALTAPVRRRIFGNSE